MATALKTTSASKRELLELCKKQEVNFLRLQFTDILGVNKNVEVPESQFDKALEGDIMFDGSSIEGFVRIEESDMVLKPDLDTFRVLPYDDEGGRIARLICDIYNPDGSSFAGCTRQALQRQIAAAKALGYEMMAGAEAEFFIFQLDASGEPTTDTHDHGGYFDQTPVDRAAEIRRLIIRDLVSMGFEVEAGHHEVAPGQHEIDFRYTVALETADNLATFRFIVRNVAYRHGFLATFMPKPIFGQNGSGMHTHQSLFKGGKNAFHDPAGKWELSATAIQYVAGLLKHARGFCAVTNPLVNSYKRLVPGYEAPTNVAWSQRNRSPLVRDPHQRRPVALRPGNVGRGLVPGHQPLVAVHERVGHGAEAARVLQQPRHVLNRGRRELPLPGGIVEGVLPALEEGLVRVHPGAVLAKDRLGHEGGKEPVAVGDVADDEPERRQVVRGLEGDRVAEIDFVLPRCDFVVTRLDLEPHRHQVPDDEAPDLLGPVHRGLIEVATVIMGVGGGLAARVELEDEELRFGARHHLVAQRLRRRDLPLQRLARASRERRPVGVVDVADEPGDAPPLVVVRQHPERVEVGLQDHVRLLDPHEPLDRRAVEHDVALERLVELALGHFDVLVDAQDVGELEAQEVDFLLLAELEQLALAGAGGLEGGGHRGIEAGEDGRGR